MGRGLSLILIQSALSRWGWQDPCSTIPRRLDRFYLASLWTPMAIVSYRGQWPFLLNGLFGWMEWLTGRATSRQGFTKLLPGTSRMNKLLKECQRLANRLDGTESSIGYGDSVGLLGTGQITVMYVPHTQGWKAQADWGYGCILSTPMGDYPKDAIRGLHRLLKAQVEALRPIYQGKH